MQDGWTGMAAAMAMWRQHFTRQLKDALIQQQSVTADKIVAYARRLGDCE